MAGASGPDMEKKVTPGYHGLFCHECGVEIRLWEGGYDQVRYHVDPELCRARTKMMRERMMLASGGSRPRPQ